MKSTSPAVYIFWCCSLEDAASRHVHIFLPTRDDYGAGFFVSFSIIPAKLLASLPLLVSLPAVSYLIASWLFCCFWQNLGAQTAPWSDAIKVCPFGRDNVASLWGFLLSSSGQIICPLGQKLGGGGDGECALHQICHQVLPYAAGAVCIWKEGGLTGGTQLLPLPSMNLPQTRVGRMGTANVHWLSNPLRIVFLLQRAVGEGDCLTQWNNPSTRHSCGGWVQFLAQMPWHPTVLASFFRFYWINASQFVVKFPINHRRLWMLVIANFD